MTKKDDYKYSSNFPEQPPKDKGRKKGENDTEPFIPKNTWATKRTVKRKKNKVTDPRVKFLHYCDEFPIDHFQIPRPLRTPLYGGSDITDSHCALYALTLLGVPHDVDITYDLKPIGWLNGPHLLIDGLGQDWSLTFDGSRLIYTLKENPWLIVTDSTVQLAIGILRVKCEQGTPRESKWAKKILKEIGINLLIPERAKRRRSEEISLRYFSNNPARLIASVKLYESVITSFWNQRYKRIGPEKKLEYIGEAFRIIFKENMPSPMFSNLKESTRIDSPINAALSFIEYETSSEYEPLRTMYYKKVDEISLSEIYFNLDRITSNKGLVAQYIRKLKKVFTGK